MFIIYKLISKSLNGISYVVIRRFPSTVFMCTSMNLKNEFNYIKMNRHRKNAGKITYCTCTKMFEGKNTNLCSNFCKHIILILINDYNTTSFLKAQGCLHL